MLCMIDFLNNLNHLLIICLQPSFRAITYDLIGDDNAPIYFRIDPTFGFVTLNTGLFSDSGIQYKVCKLIKPFITEFQSLSSDDD